MTRRTAGTAGSPRVRRRRQPGDAGSRLRLIPRLLSPGLAVAEAVRTLLATHGCARPDKIWLLTQPGTGLRRFNPVNFVLCERDGALIAVVAEVTNTPWGERHCYVIPDATGGVDFDKTFHVSPFQPMQCWA